MNNIALQIAIEGKYSKKRVRKYIMDSVDRQHDLVQKMADKIVDYRTAAHTYYSSKEVRVIGMSNISAEDIAVIICTAVLPLAGSSPIQMIVASIGSHLGYENILDGVKTAAELLAVCEDCGLYDLVRSSSTQNVSNTLKIVPKYALSPEVLKVVGKTKYLPPMISPPGPWTSNTDGGHLHEANKGSIILQHIKEHGKPQNLKAINVLQDIAWSLNDMVDFVEKPDKVLITKKKQDQFKVMAKQSLDVYKELLELDNKFYFVWKYDNRGRMYSQGYHCNLQGTEYKKAILNFAHEELIQ